MTEAISLDTEINMANSIEMIKILKKVINETEGFEDFSFGIGAPDNGWTDEFTNDDFFTHVVKEIPDYNFEIVTEPATKESPEKLKSSKVLDRIREIVPEYVSEKEKSLVLVNRAKEYPSVGDQLDMLWHAMDNGTIPVVDDFYNTIKQVKDNNPKP